MIGVVEKLQISSACIYLTGFGIEAKISNFKIIFCAGGRDGLQENPEPAEDEISHEGEFGSKRA